MKRFIQVISLLLSFAGAASAQDFTLTSPVAQPSETKFVVGRVDLSRTPNLYGLVQINVMDSTKTVLIRYFNVSVPKLAGDDAVHPSASLVSFVNAIMTSRSGETGPVPQRFDYRVLGWLSDNGYLPAGTLNP